MSKWIPIKNAPGNTLGLVYIADVGRNYRSLSFGGVHESIAENEVYRMPYAEGYSGGWKITHWMPLPDVPE